MTLYRKLSIVILLCIVLSCKKNTAIDNLKIDLIQQIKDIEGDIAVVFLNLSSRSDTILINADEKFHAASTMKVPVMIELYKQQHEKKLQLQDSITVVNEFKSIVDGSLYAMDIADDSDDIIYNKIGMKLTTYDLMYSMITISSNLATNILIEDVGAKNVTATMKSLGAPTMNVLRGVEDQKAYDLGLSNSTTARDLMVIMKAIASGEAGNKEDCKEMISILRDQKWNDMIPKYLPKNIKVAHKTGAITGVHHDAAIVDLPDGKSYILVLLSKNLKDWDLGTDKLAKISETVYNYVASN